MKYSIGQVLFVVLNKKTQVYPMQVVEIITKKTMRGEEIQYLLQAGSDKTSNIMLNQVDGEVFDTSDSAREMLKQRAIRQIDKLVDAATEKSKEWYQISSSAQTIHDLPDLSTKTESSAKTSQSHLDEDTNAVMLPDGTVAKVRLPSF